jgi:hypothetical protein
LIIQKLDPLIIYQPDRRELGALRRMERSPTGDLSMCFPDAIIFPRLEKRFVKHSARGCAQSGASRVVG